MRSSDAVARAAALDPQASFIVQAPAGSGKTSLLVQRLLTLLARVDEPEQIVAITFTRKAAAEMRVRLLEALGQAHEPEPASEHERLTRRLAQAVLARDAERGWNLVLNSGRLRLQTFDALCASLVRRMPLASGLGGMPRVVEQPRELHLEAARATVALLDEGTPEHSASVAAVLAHLDNRVPRLQELIADMLAQRDQWLRLLLQSEHDERTTLEAALAAARRAAHERVRELAPADAAFWSLPAQAAQRLGPDGDHALAACLGLAALPAPQDEAAWAALVHFWLTSEDDWRKAFNKKLGVPPKTEGANAQQKQEHARFKEEVVEQAASMAEDEDLRAALGALRGLPAATYTEAQWQVLGAIVAVLKLAVAQLRLVFSARGEADFAEVAAAAIAALDAGEGPTDLAVALDARLTHLLVDEFQDTSHSQHELLRLLTRGWQDGDGRTVFLVGDPMQSVYRFREADVGLFLRTRRHGLHDDLRPRSLLLTRNFRSQAGVVEWVNAAFPQVLPAQEDFAAGAVTYSPAEAAHEALPGVAVAVHALAGGPEDEAALVVEAVRAARAEDPGGSIAVLVRGRSHLAAIAPALRAAGEACAAVEIDPLASRAVIQDLHALTRALLHPADRVAWLAVLRAPWCGLALADLAALAEGTVAPVPTLLDDADCLARLSAEGRERALRLREVLWPVHAQVRRAPLHTLVEQAWLALAGPACCASAADLADAEAWFGLLAEIGQAGALPRLAELDERLAQLYARPEAVDERAVQLMTIHKAKGLEFDTVIVPGLQRRPRGNARRLLTWMERARAAGGRELLLAPLAEAGDEDEPIGRYLARVERERERLEAGRLLYVAATRAKRRLHLLGSASFRADKGAASLAEPPADSLLARLWPAVSAAFAGATPPAQEPGEASAPTIEQSLRRLPLRWRAPATPCLAPPASPETELARRESIEFSWAGEAARHVGTVVHAWLARYTEPGGRWKPEELPQAARRIERELAQAGVPAAERPAAGARVRAALAAAWADQRGRWLLEATQEARSEWRLTGLDAGELVDVSLDRSFVDEAGIRWIVDYKTGSHEGGGREAFLDREQERYRAQLERYARLVAALEPGRTIRLGLYFPLLQAWREWAPGGQGGVLR
jgi:ATP-dependent helicase/nuclease subunit A